MKFVIQEEGRFKYVEQGAGPTLLLLHGLFGALSNFSDLIIEFSARYRVIIPILPLYEDSDWESNVDGMVEFAKDFAEFKSLDSLTLIGNSLGGHIAILFAIKYPELVNAMVLTGSSGLFENTLGGTYPKRGSYEFVKAKTESTFYDPAVSSKELVDEVFEIVNDRSKIVKVLRMAKSAIRHNVGKELHNIKCPTLLIWGNQDQITPPFVGEDFKKLIPNSELKFIEHCGHAAMMEKPQEFNELLQDFLNAKQ